MCDVGLLVEQFPQSLVGQGVMECNIRKSWACIILSHYPREATVPLVLRACARKIPIRAVLPSTLRDRGVCQKAQAFELSADSRQILEH